uniref:Uncharacterized protein n=1 Tax=Oryza nivara TaxID=4536 RepID=A0A0E0HQD9_ORYNI
MDRQWMYADRRSKEFIDGLHYFLGVANDNKRNCAKQEKGTNLCGNYVCHYMHCLAHQIRTGQDLEMIYLIDNTTHDDFIRVVQEQIMGFINKQILDRTREFYYDGSTIHKAGPCSSDATKS